MINIIWTDLAIEDILENIDYLEKEWTEKEVLKFNKKVDEILQKISKGNLIFKSTGYKNIFQIVITKQVTLFYKKQNDDVFLLRFWNNYRDLKNLKL
jgi:plasmid stabilization system protein ParE